MAFLTLAKIAVLCSITRPRGRFTFGVISDSMANRFIQYVKDVRGEMTHVAWPTQKQTAIFTALVIAVSIVTALYLGAFDYVFTSVLDTVI